MSFTKEEALKFHRDMWGKIKEKYGNNATKLQRMEVKIEYLRSKGHACVNQCYLCDYSFDEARKKRIGNDCVVCPIDWSTLTDEDDPVHGTCIALYKNGYDSIYKCAPIDEILALPERKEVSE